MSEIHHASLWLYLCRLLIMLAKSGNSRSAPHLRRCAWRCSLIATCCAGGFDAAVAHAARIMPANKQPRDR